jgi:predicted nucleotidyltransferase component of viral defense system
VTDPPERLTDKDKLDELAQRFALTDTQARLLVAKTAVAKLVSMADADEQFVLKGGTLLHHVHGSPRVSLADIDYADGRDPKIATVESVKLVLRTEHRLGFRVDVDGGHWITQSGLVSGSEIPVFLAGVHDDGQPVNVSVAVRAGEVLEMVIVEFVPSGLADERAFKVRAISLAEAAAEKIIAWCIKGKPKHFHDLAFIAREDPTIDHAHVAGMVAHKFAAEREAQETREEYTARNLVTPRDLERYWKPERRMNHLRAKWADELGTEIILDLDEQDRSQDSLADFDAAYRLATHCFDGVFDHL